MEYMGGGKEPLGGDSLLCGSVALTVSFDPDRLSSLGDFFGGMASFISGSFAAMGLSCMKDEAEERSERRLDFPVRAALVREWSELPDESAGDSWERSEAELLCKGDRPDSLLSEEPLEKRSLRIFSRT